MKNINEEKQVTENRSLIYSGYLQHFAEEGEQTEGDNQNQEQSGEQVFGHYDPGAPNGEIDHGNPLLQGNEDDQNPEGENQEGENPEGNEGGEATPPPDEPEFLDFGGRKVDPRDPEAVRQAQQDYAELQRTYQQTNQQNKTYEQIIQQFQQGQAPPQEQQSQQQNQDTSQPSAERMSDIHETYMDKMYENKIEADRWLQSQPEYKQMMQEQLKSMIDPIIEPIKTEMESSKKEKEWNEKVQKAESSYQDFKELTPQIQEVLNQNPDLASMQNGIDIAYKMAKTEHVQQQPSPEQLANDPKFQEQMMQNQEFVNKVMQGYAKQKNQSNQQVPPLMGGQPSGSSPTLPPNKPKSLGEASEQFRRHLGL